MENVDGARFAAISGDLAGLEEIFALKMLSHALASPNTDCRQTGAQISCDGGRAGYLFNTTIEGIDQADVILLIGTNPRTEAAVLNARIRSGVSSGRISVGLVGEKVDLSYEYDHLGEGPQTLVDILGGKNSFSETLKAAKNPMLILGEGATARR